MAKEKNFSNTDKTQPKKVLIVLNDGSVYWLEAEKVKKIFSNIPGAKKPIGDITELFSITPGAKKPNVDMTEVFSKYLKQEGQENTDKTQQDQGRSEKAKKRNERKPLFKDSDVAEMVSGVTKLDGSGVSEMMSNVSRLTGKEELKEIIDNMAENTDKTQPKKVLIVLSDGSVHWLEAEKVKKIFSNIPGAKKPIGDMTELFSNTPGVKKPDGDVTKVFSNYSNSTEEQNDKAKAEQDITLSDAIKIMHHNRSYMGVLMRRDSCWQNVFDGIDGKDSKCAEMVAEWADENSESSISFKQTNPEQYALIKKLVSDKTLDSSYVQMLRLYARVQNALKGRDDLLYVKHFINKIDLIDDDKLKYDIVHSIQSENAFRVRDAEITRACATFCVNSPLASIEDFVAYQPFVAPSQMSQFCADAEKIVGDQIKSELSEITPDFDKIQRSVNDLTRLVSMIEDSEISSAMKKHIRDNFDLKKLMAADAMEYIARGEQNTADQIRSLEKQLSDAQSRIATLETRLMNVTQERDAAQQNFDASVVHSNGLYDKYMKSAQDLQMLIDSASKMKSGLGSSGVKDYQALVQKIKANSRNN